MPVVSSNHGIFRLNRDIVGDFLFPGTKQSGNFPALDFLGKLDESNAGKSRLNREFSAISRDFTSLYFPGTSTYLGRT